jgi:FKBP-type peptidyl-prolyl cis-trans isomerase
MRSIIKTQLWLWTAAFVLAGLGSGCGKKAIEKPSADAIQFKPYTIQDSSRIVTYPDGLKLYVVKGGSGDYPINGTNVRMHYYGTLDDGTVFDESYSRNEPLEFGMGSEKVIEGIELAVRKLRLGSQAIAIIPPSLGYGDGKGKQELPPKIPANARLTFHLDLIGSF